MVPTAKRYERVTYRRCGRSACKVVSLGLCWSGSMGWFGTDDRG
ncbi:MAG: hypothetical protein ACRDYE_09855 [Acidimicrobiales bacterium]